MLHTMTLIEVSSEQPFLLHCSCGTGGAFVDVNQALAYKEKHFGRLGGIDTGEFINTLEPAPAPAPEPEPEPVPVPAPAPEPEPPQAQETVGDA